MLWQDTVLKNLVHQIAAISVGIVNGQPLLDLPYIEDAAADVDLNIVMTSTGGFVEVQGTAESAPYSRTELDQLLDLATAGIQDLNIWQNNALK